MKLYYIQPDYHGPYSWFVMAESAEAAARLVNEMAEREGIIKDCEWEGPFKASDFKSAEPGEVLFNGND